jgi:hypothetical protein
MSEEPLTIEEFHHLALELAHESQELSFDKFIKDDFPIVNYAIFNIVHDAIIIHRSIQGLVFNGWSSSGAILERTLLDLTISMIAIVNSKNPTLAAFSYFNANHRQILRDNSFSIKTKQEIKQLIRKQIQQLKPEDRTLAYKFLREKNRPYWFWQEWNSPKKVIEAFASTSVLEDYQTLSSAAHGGFYGLKYFRDNGTEYNLNPRLPFGRLAMLVSAATSRKLIEIVSVRGLFENLNLESKCSNLRERIETIEVLKKTNN